MRVCKEVFGVILLLHRDQFADIMSIVRQKWVYGELSIHVACVGCITVPYMSVFCKQSQYWWQGQKEV